jgi:hypothetical protein
VAVVIVVVVMVMNMIVMAMTASTLDVIVVAMPTSVGVDVIGMAMIVVAVVFTVFAVDMSATPGTTPVPNRLQHSLAARHRWIEVGRGHGMRRRSSGGANRS